jgi:hypothetical protein
VQPTTTDCIGKGKFMDRRDIFKFQEKALFRSLGDDGVVLKVDSGQMFSCNETAEAFLRRVDGNSNVDEIALSVCEEYDVEPETLLSDLGEMIDELLKENVLEKV